ncbi:hypothetical protein VR7878_00157 [Vibrio ruber DSM 16370]|uniref:Uncharacterized protein n=1 Tax=Vibrio ruber (strain DSM 16370 / JCM 11486 / BCRC 17186 / CECT 7878 / LMG 23124 / VR1) TaxID=1123498 RepID=A0A1R4L9I1_VIBR1|nr:hypothetical protein [Vibrio ruber]SJN53047.1 hypothetical protein VR7878_00157 [Vibrio ruber DSM 16370]
MKNGALRTVFLLAIEKLFLMTEISYHLRLFFVTLWREDAQGKRLLVKKMLNSPFWPLCSSFLYLSIVKDKNNGQGFIGKKQN